MTPASGIRRCFVEWHDANADRFLEPVRRGEATPRSLRLDFPTLGLEDTLWAALRESEIAVYAAVEGKVWDLLVSLDEVRPEEAGNGWVCGGCARGSPYTGHVPEVYASPEDLWRGHLFEQFLDWVNGKLARAETLAFYRFGRASTSAYLSPVDGLARDTPPVHSFPLRRNRAP